MEALIMENPQRVILCTAIAVIIGISCYIYRHFQDRGEKGKKIDTMWIRRAWVILGLDCISIVCAYFMALFIRFDFIFSNIPEEYLYGYINSMPYWVCMAIVIFYIFRLYHSIWIFASVPELQKIMASYVILIPAYGLGTLIMGLHMPCSYYTIGMLISFCMTTAIRFGYRLLRVYRNNISNKYGIFGNKEQGDRIMVIGAGSAGQIIIKELIRHHQDNEKVICVIDDNPNKIGRNIQGIPIVGNRYDIHKMVGQCNINRIIYAIPAASGKTRKEILSICKDTNCKVQTLPGIYQLVNGEISIRRLRNVEIHDLLGREQIKVNNDEILSSISGKTVLVTGGGGSIGSELCRQIATSEPKQLIIFEMYENNAYDIQQELLRKYPDLNLVTLIGSVRNTSRINSVMQTYKPDVVFHAAAHKHVPFMEDSPNEAIKNNVFGTYKTASAAAETGVKKFVLISTDKAVNPTNVMGASKRICEMCVQMMDRKCPNTDFVAVRFGNVLGSNGSVIPLFKKQIAEGGPVTVTDKRIVRYFMTIPEAVSLVLQASYYAKGGDIFVFDMGEPVKIDDLARNLIRLSGFVPDVDIKIKYTGLRPGEKLYEELLLNEEGLQETQNSLIYIGKPIEMDDEWFVKKLDELKEAMNAESEYVKEIVAEIVPSYKNNKTN